MGAPHCAAMTAFIFSWRTSAARRQHGAAAIEFAVAGAIVLLLGLLCVDAARWHGARQMAHLALMEAARAGATGHGDPARLRTAFLQALLPLHTSASGPAGAIRRRDDAMNALNRLTGAAPWRIEVLRPDDQSFREHGRADLQVAAAPGLRVIDNGYQDLQHARHPPRPGGQDIFLANTLKLRLTYLHKPLLPPLRALLVLLGRQDGTYTGHALNNGLLPIVVELEHEMHTHPVDWARKRPYPEGVVYGECRQLRCGSG